MANKFGVPLILSGGLIPIDSTGSEVFDESNQTTVDPYACGYDEWVTMFEGDYNGDEVIDENDYIAWFLDNGFGPEAWEKYNPGVPYPGPVEP